MMSEEIQLRIVTPRKPVLDERVLEVTAPGTLGEFGVLPNHAALLSSLEIGRLSYRSERGAKHLAVRGGFAEVVNNVVTVLAEAAEPAEEMDGARAEADRRDAESRMKDLSPLDPAYSTADADHRWALARLEAAKGR
jgi:F-type H+-transporting ATPase subunit epsilon